MESPILKSTSQIISSSEKFNAKFIVAEKAPPVAIESHVATDPKFGVDVEPTTHGVGSVELAATVNNSLERVCVTAAPITFTPSLGAWMRLLNISFSSATEALSIPKEDRSIRPQDLTSPTLWPSLDARQGHVLRHKLTTASTRAKEMTVSKLSVENIYPPEIKEDGNLRFSWAAKMNPSMRNLYRTTSPTYLEDGTPKIIILSHILLHGSESQK